MAVIAATGDGPRRLLAIGEAKWNDQMGRAHLERLERIRELLQKSGKFDATNTWLMCMSGAGFNEPLSNSATEREDIKLIGLEELYA